MITCTLGDKRYTVPYANGRAYRNLDDALEAYQTLAKADENTRPGEAIQAMSEWFAHDLFRGQFSADELLDEYPADRLIPDLVTAILSVNNGMSAGLRDFPTTPAAETETTTETTI